MVNLPMRIAVLRLVYISNSKPDDVCSVIITGWHPAPQQIALKPLAEAQIVASSAPRYGAHNSGRIAEVAITHRKVAV